MKALTVRAEAGGSRLHGRWLLLPVSASCSLLPPSASQWFPAPGVGLERGPEVPRQDNRFRLAAGDVLSDVHAASSEARAPAHAGRGEGAPPHSADLSNAAIGEILDIKLPTVKAHVSHVMQKLGVMTRAKAKAAVRKLGLVWGQMHRLSAGCTRFRIFSSMLVLRAKGRVRWSETSSRSARWRGCMGYCARRSFSTTGRGS